jgi:NADH-ubiquinone oxidoreductase chain 5
MYLTILILPLLGSIISGFFGRKIGVTGSHIVTITCLLLSSILSSIAFYEVIIEGSPVEINITKWVNSGILMINWGFLFDSLSVAMLIPVLFISTLVHLFSVDYMSGDPHNQRFFSYLSLFTFFMLILVSGSNYLVMFVGWEGIGIVSFLLISFWYTRIPAVKAATQALIMNRVGDMLLSIGFFAMIALFGSLDFATIFSLSPYINETYITIIGLLIFAGATAKSAQIPLHVWLPASMEGPTPVSALIHAATLVTAGIYLLLRSSWILEYSPLALIVIVLVGSITAIFAATSGLVQNDLKRIIAFSTISQLGYMVAAIGISQYNVALFHLVNHAFFKALLFLSAGQIIHSMMDEQDIRKLGSLIKFLPLTYSIMVIGSLSLLATPFLTGFFSKDLIIELAYAKYSISGTFSYYLLSITAGLTAFYSFRLIMLTFFTSPNSSKVSYLNVHEAKGIVIIALLILSLFSIFFGYIFSDLFVGIGNNSFGSSLFIHPNHINLIEAEFSIPLLFKLMPALFSLLGSALAIILYQNKPEFIISLTNYSNGQAGGNLGRKLYTFFNGKYFFDIIYNYYFTRKSLQFGFYVTNLLERGIIEFIGPYGLSNVLFLTGKNISKLDTGIVTSYALYIVLGLISLVFLIFSPLISQVNWYDISEPALALELRIIIIYISSFILYLMINFYKN